ncbi:DUF3168 domain-containing protein [Aquamicrobium sp. NLF2-7]|uniref:DUF3168 domain-containing protein n=1 Tax=Aquamicrobium sp. NLF2-7 TaxID=2918753 RepID=UPI001EFC14A0|nr:DUF3168 domain-containing protein [Aquamicrobium sp. NLF2-7]MCG8271561.1 DUF3168 domain-containing protein [Aquamicrobium sp. NLF2-7]
MSDPSAEIQVALVERLTALATEAGERIYDDVPPEDERVADTGAAYPYVTVGAGQLVPVDEECFDRSSTYFQIDVWTRTVGFPQAKRIAGTIRTALHEQTLAVNGHVVDRMRVESIDYSRDPNGLSRRARLDQAHS